MQCDDLQFGVTWMSSGWKSRSHVAKLYCTVSIVPTPVHHPPYLLPLISPLIVLIGVSGAAEDYSQLAPVTPSSGGRKEGGGCRIPSSSGIVS